MFKEKITKEGNTFTIEVSIELRKFAVEDKLIYSGNPRLILPEDIKDLAILKSQPSKKVSNMKKEKYSNYGVWVFELPEPEGKDKPAPSRPATRTRRAKANPKQENKPSTKPATRSIIKKEVKKTQE